MKKLLRFLGFNVIERASRKRGRIMSTFTRMINGLKDLNHDLEEDSEINHKLIDDLKKENFDISIEIAANKAFIDKLNQFNPNNGIGI